ncbi:hypothetical protein [Actinoplanes sp. NPDC049599]|uniref:hypothetical protein n=1 Tax=Actinoplanes sp. NPDC049599 TaxID=3363903 RepID=UPI00378F0C87
MSLELDERKSKSTNLEAPPPQDAEAVTPPPTAPPRSRGRRGPVKLTVNLLARVMDRLEEVCGFTGESRTDAINRSIQLYALYHDTVRDGGTFVVRARDGREREFHVL